MTSAIIVHGKPSKATYFDRSKPSTSNQIWLPWLQKELQLAGISVQTPEMMNAWQPDYKVWSKTFEQYTLTPDTLLVGHSMGAGFILQWLTEHSDVSVGHVILVAPSLGDRFTPEHPLDVELLNGMTDFDLQPELLARVRSLTILNSDNDGPRIQDTVKHLRDIFPDVPYHEFHNYGHFTDTGDMSKDGSFPELLEIILELQRSLEGLTRT